MTDGPNERGMPEDDSWRSEANTYLDMLTAGVLTRRLGAYPAWLDGDQVIVLAYMNEQPNSTPENPLYESKPLAILYNDELHRRLDLPHATKRPIKSDGSPL